MSDDTQAVLELERRRCEAIGAMDAAVLGEVLADDYLHVFGGGDTSGKAGYIEQILRTPRVPERGELAVRLYGDVAVITGDLINRVEFPDKGLTVIDAYVTQVAHRSAGQWRFVSFQITPKRRSPAK